MALFTGDPPAAKVDGSTGDTIHVVEVSSFQLETTTTFRPWIAVLLNLSADHLDRHVNSVEEGMTLRKNGDGKIIAVLNHLGGSELRLHVHPQFYSADLEHEMLAYAEENYFATAEDGRRYVCLPIFEDDTRRQELVQSRGYKKQPGWGHHYRRDLTALCLSHRPQADTTSGLWAMKANMPPAVGVRGGHSTR